MSDVARPGQVRGRRLLLAIGAMAMVTLMPLPALADPARPSNYESEVIEIEPQIEGFEAVVVGGDSFLSLTVPSGVALEVPGYQGEPYLRFEPGGRVLVNRNSPSHWVNEDRFGQAAVPSGASAEAEPDWQVVAENGRWAWHDHRIHWMSPDLPPSVEGTVAQEVYPWVVPVVADGMEMEIRGVLTWHPSTTPTPWLLLAGAIAAGLLLLRRKSALIGVILLMGAVGGLLLSIAQVGIAPPGAGGEVVAIGAASLAMVGGLGAVAVSRRNPRLALGAAVIGAVLLSVWGLQRVSALWMPVLPGPFPEPWERAIVAVALGVGGGVVVAALDRFRSLAPG